MVEQRIHVEYEGLLTEGVKTFVTVDSGARLRSSQPMVVVHRGDEGFLERLLYVLKCEGVAVTSVKLQRKHLGDDDLAEVVA